MPNYKVRGGGGGGGVSQSIPLCVYHSSKVRTTVLVNIIIEEGGKSFLNNESLFLGCLGPSISGQFHIFLLFLQQHGKTTKNFQGQHNKRPNKNNISAETYHIFKSETQRKQQKGDLRALFFIRYFYHFFLFGVEEQVVSFW